MRSKVLTVAVLAVYSLLILVGWHWIPCPTWMCSGEDPLDPGLAKWARIIVVLTLVAIYALMMLTLVVLVWHEAGGKGLWLLAGIVVLGIIGAPPWVFVLLFFMLWLIGLD